MLKEENNIANGGTGTKMIFCPCQEQGPLLYQIRITITIVNTMISISLSHCQEELENRVKIMIIISITIMTTMISPLSPPPSRVPSIFSCTPADVWEAASPLELHNHPHHQGVRNTKYKTRQIHVSVIVTVITDRCTNCKSSAKEPSSCRVRRLF